MRTAKVVSCYVGWRGEWNTRCSISLCLQAIKFHVDVLKTVTSEIPMDVIFVNQINNDLLGNDKYAKYISYLNSIDGEKIKNGKIIVHHRPNVGAMNGAYNFARYKYRDWYDYWWFSEDDRISIGSSVMDEAVSKLLQNEKLGMVAAVSLQWGKSPPRFLPDWGKDSAPCPIGYARSPYHHLDIRRGKYRLLGGAAITSKKILSAIFWNRKVRNHFELPHYKPCSTQIDVWRQCLTRTHQSYEHTLCNVIYNRGYDIEHLSPDNDCVIHWGSEEEGRQVKWSGRGGWNAYALPWDKNMGVNDYTNLISTLRPRGASNCGKPKKTDMEIINAYLADVTH